MSEEPSPVTVRPLGNRILCEAVRRSTRNPDGLIVIPEQYRPDDLEFKIVAVGPGRLLKNGEREPIPVEVGWRVISHAYSAKHVELEEQKLRLIHMDDVLMVLPP